MTIEAWDQKWIEERDRYLKKCRRTGKLIDFLAIVGYIVCSFLFGVFVGVNWW
jgi:hypothetical protein